MSVEHGSVQLTLDEIPPQWAADYDDPVVVGKRGCPTFHEPDLDADEPRPVCRYGSRDDVNWNVRERRDALAWKDSCDACPGGHDE